MKKLLFTISLLLIFSSIVLADESGDVDCRGKISFRTAEVFVDSNKNALAGYQIDIRYDRDKVKIMQLEGGADGFKKPPFYDRTGLEGGHIIIAAFVDNDLQAKRGSSRVARLYLQTRGCPPFTLKTESMAAVKPGGKEIPVKVEIVSIDGQGLSNR